MKVKGEATYLKKWMHKGKTLGKEPPPPSEAPYNLDHADDRALEQLNLKVPKGTKLRLKRLGLEQGGLSMRRMFKRMLDEYEERHQQKG